MTYMLGTDPRIKVWLKRLGIEGDDVTRVTFDFTTDSVAKVSVERLLTPELMLIESPGALVLKDGD